jgi:hypothetical protein
MKKITLIIILSVAYFSSCKDKDAQPEPEKRTLTIEYSLIADGGSYKIDKDTLMLESGNEITSTRVSFLLSKFYLIDANNEKIHFKDQYGYVDIGDGDITVKINDVDEGDYKGLGFTLGLDSVINHGDPSSYAISHPLNAVRNGLHWTWADGYVFIALEGGLTQTNEGYSYHLSGTDKPVAYEFFENFEIKDGNKKAKVAFDIAEVFKSPNTIDIYSEGHAIHVVNTPLGDKMFENLTNAFSLIEIK